MNDDHNPADDAWVDALLTKSVGHTPHVDDQGFADRVMARLPARRRRLHKREIVIALSTLGAGAFGVLGIVGSNVGSSAVRLSLDAVQANPMQLVGLVTVVGLALWGALASAEG